MALRAGKKVAILTVGAVYEFWSHPASAESSKMSSLGSFPVEDEEPVRVAAGLMLKALGYRLLQAASGEEALRLFEASREKIGPLMTDVVMPGMSGPRWPRRSGPGTRT